MSTIWRHVFKCFEHACIIKKVIIKAKSFTVRSRKIIASNFKKKKILFDNLNIPVVSDNAFWTVKKPFFINKVSFRRNIQLIEKEEILKDDAEVAE